ncbi:phage terminase large subunit family protein [Iodidimonas gelatinilytica]|uniref:phage terminase large subunit family protein n=1 Tax=Iodidimonas gelatinilytica TaxID=1236966 RepID=UPI0035305A1F
MPKWAEHYRKLKNPKGGYSGPWRHDIAPHLIEPMNALSDPSVSLVGLQGPAQSGKSDIGLNWWAATIHQQPTDFMICQPDKAMMQDFVVRRLEPLIDQHRVLKEKMLPGGSSDNIFLKRFKGMLSTHIWPVGAQFRARPVPWGWLDDYDDFPEDIDGQGSALSLLEGRQTTFEGAEKTYVSSSPARDGGGGIEAICEAGSNERFHWRCLIAANIFRPSSISSSSLIAKAAWMMLNARRIWSVRIMAASSIRHTKDRCFCRRWLYPIMVGCSLIKNLATTAR